MNPDSEEQVHEEAPGIPMGRRLRRPRTAAVVTALVGVALSIVLFYLRMTWERTRLEDAFAGEAANVNLAIEREVGLFVDVLESLGSLHGISADIERGAFEEFVNKGLLYHRYILGVFGWAPRVTRYERPVYEMAMRRAGHDGFSIRERVPGVQLAPAVERDEYFPVSYVEPAGASELPIGFDFGSDPVSRQALKQSRETGATTASGYTILGDPPQDRQLRLVVTPIYQGDPQGERGALGGFIVAVLQPEHVLEKALDRAAPMDVEVCVFDESAPAGQRLLYSNVADGGTVKGSVVRSERTVDMAGQTWTVTCTPGPSFVELYRTWQPLGLLLVGLLLTGLVTAQLLFVAGRAAEIERTVEKRTAELTAANKELLHSMHVRRRLEQEILEISDREKRRVGQDLHDSLGQQLTGTGYLNSALERKLAARSLPEAENASKIGELLKEAIGQLRRIARGLSPIDVGEDGLSFALKRLAEDSEQLYGLTCRFEESTRALIYDNVTAINLYHIAQEALSNAARHANPRNIVISLSLQGSEGELRIEDDGSGLPDNVDWREGMGLQIMQHRADLIDGSLQVLRRPEGGTRVICRFQQEGAPEHAEES